MCFGKSKPPAPQQIREAPPVAQIEDVIDEAGGMESVVVTGADGKKRRVIRRLPRTPEEQQKFQMVEDLISSSMRNITQLYRYDPQSVVEYAPLIDTFANLDRQRMDSLARVANIGNIDQEVATFKQMQSELTDEHFDNLNRTNEAALIRSGVSNSSYAAESRASMVRAHRLARLEGDAKASMYGEDLASKRFSRNKQAFELEEMGREGQLQTAQARYGLAKDYESDQDRRRLLAIQENKDNLNIGLGIAGEDKKLALSQGQFATEASLAAFNARNNAETNNYRSHVLGRQTQDNINMSNWAKQPLSFWETTGNFAGKIANKAIESKMPGLPGAK